MDEGDMFLALMAVIRIPRFMGGGPRPAERPIGRRDKEIEAMEGIDEWLSQLSSDESKLRVLAYFMWRLKSGDGSNMALWVESVAEQSAVEVSRRAGFSEGVK